MSDLNEYLSGQRLTFGISGNKLCIVGGPVSFTQPLSPECIRNLIEIGHACAIMSHDYAFTAIPVVGDLDAD